MNAATLVIGLALCSAATAYALLTLLAVASSHWRRRADPAPDTPVTILKPLHGMEPRLYENLRSFCVQDYPTFQVLLGMRDPADPALPIARRIQQDFPDLDIEVVVDPQLHGRNHKVGNLANLVRHARHPWLVIADSDISVGPDYLRRVCPPLADPGTGIVTCLYRGRALGGLWSRLGALFIDEWFVPAVHIARLFGSREFGFGATLALRRDTLGAIGGFESIADQLADDYRIAERARALGLETKLSGYIVTTDVAEASLHQLVQHELRWMRTIRMLSPLGYPCMVISFGVVVAAIGAAIAGGTPGALALLALTCAARATLHLAVARHARGWFLPRLRTLPLIVLRDVLNVGLWATAFAGHQVTWAGRELHSRDARPL
ncbi:MAG TPA: bacteriohopanetetrol glucosamine biosynthesis glycosyltransferase HpnI [Rhodanobacteraceae bacterium]